MPGKLVKPTIVFKVTLLAASIAVLGSFMMGVLVSRTATNIAYDEEVKYLGFVAHTKAQDLLEKLTTLTRDTQYLAGTPPIQGIPRAMRNSGIDPQDQSSVQDWKQRLATIFFELSRAKPFYQQIRYIAAFDNGKELVRTNRVNGKVIVVPEEELQNKGNRSYFQLGLNAKPGEVHLSGIELNREHGKLSLPYTPTIRSVLPVYSAGQIYGMIVINMDLRMIFDELATQAPTGASVYLVSEMGYFLEHPDQSKVFAFEFGKDIRVQQMYENFDPSKDVGTYENNFIETNAKDVVHTAVAFYDKLNANRYVAIMLAVSQKSMLAKSSEIRRTIIKMVFLLMIFSIFAAGLMARQLITPLRLIAKASEDLVKGNDVDYLPINKHDEIGDLARSFDIMRHQLQGKNRELLESQAQSHHANKLASLGEMASGMAHEINTPIQTISLIAQRVKRRKEKLSRDEVADEMDKITNNISKVSQIIESLRKVSRNSSRDDYLPVVLGDILDDALQITRERFRIRGIDFSCHLDEVDKDTMIECKRISITQILINLLNNAHDEVADMEPSWIRLEVSSSATDVVFSMADSGHGIPADIQDKLFEPLFTTKEIGKGTGLGLSISREIARNHHGDLYYDGDSGNTRFVLVIPKRQRQGNNQHFGETNG